MSNPHHHPGIDYIEISVTDIEAAKAFYGGAFGWSFNDYAPGYCGFVDHSRGDVEAGGFARVEEVTGGGPLIVIYSVALEASLAAVQSNGGVVTKDIFEFPGGRRFELTDPFGNRLAVWTPG